MKYLIVLAVAASSVTSTQAAATRTRIDADWFFEPDRCEVIFTKGSDWLTIRHNLQSLEVAIMNEETIKLSENRPSDSSIVLTYEGAETNLSHIGYGVRYGGGFAQAFDGHEKILRHISLSSAITFSTRSLTPVRIESNSWGIVAQRLAGCHYDQNRKVASTEPKPSQYLTR